VSQSSAQVSGQKRQLSEPREMCLGRVSESSDQGPAVKGDVPPDPERGGLLEVDVCFGTGRTVEGGDGQRVVHMIDLGTVTDVICDRDVDLLASCDLAEAAVDVAGVKVRRRCQGRSGSCQNPVTQ